MSIENGLTANKLYKSAIDLRFTSLPFTEWIEKKGEQHVKYQNNGGDLSFTEWEYQNQSNAIKLKKVLVYTVSTLAIVGIGYYIITRVIKSNNNN